jgi:hypothetical protein
MPGKRTLAPYTYPQILKQLRIGNGNWTSTDGSYLPPDHKGTVFLVAGDLIGIVVLQSKDELWNTAEFLRKISNPMPSLNYNGGSKIGNSLVLVPRDAGNSCNINKTGPGAQDKLPFINITAQVDTLLGV